MNTGSRFVGKEIATYFHFVRSSRAALGSKFPESWRHTLIIDILGIIAAAEGNELRTDFTLIKRYLPVSDATLCRYVDFLAKHDCIDFEIDTVSGLPDIIHLTPAAASAIRSALSSLDPAQDL